VTVARPADAVPASSGRCRLCNARFTCTYCVANLVAISVLHRETLTENRLDRAIDWLKLRCVAPMRSEELAEAVARTLPGGEPGPAGSGNFDRRHG
jgi:hypothetical protein